jgi:hypothetical protein
MEQYAARRSDRGNAADDALMVDQEEHLPLTKTENFLYLHFLNRGCTLLMGFQLA